MRIRLGIDIEVEEKYLALIGEMVTEQPAIRIDDMNDGGFVVVGRLCHATEISEQPDMGEPGT
jgi:hypothetical protein